MKTKTQHTPTPWEIGPVIDGAEEYNECANVRGVQIRGQRKAVACLDDAAFIVRAVNSHEALIKRIEILGRMLEKATGWTVKEIAESIAQAEGKKLTDEKEAEIYDAQMGGF